MREIKFRVWIKIDDKLRCFENPNLIWRNGKYYVDLERFPLTIQRFEIDGINCILEQFTGLYDKNGKEIYEGDILATHNSNPEYDLWNKEYYGYTSVVWSEEYSCFTCDSWVWDYGDTAFDFKFIEIIGNIHENYELLENL